MFRIGDFSRLTRVSLKTLRHYDAIGLFKPAYVDPFTDYRYYTFDQLPRLNRILALKGLGFSLEYIRQMLDDDLSVNALRGMLQLRRMQLEQDLVGFNAKGMKALAEENQHLKTRLGLLVRLLISKGIFTAQEYADLIAEAQPSGSDQQRITATPPSKPRRPGNK